MRRLGLGFTVGGSEGRTLRVRPAFAGEGVQLGIVGKRGGLVEAFCTELTHVPGLIMAIDACSEWAWEEFNKHPRPRAFGKELT